MNQIFPWKFIFLRKDEMRIHIKFKTSAIIIVIMDPERTHPVYHYQSQRMHFNRHEIQCTMYTNEVDFFRFFLRKKCFPHFLTPLRSHNDKITPHYTVFVSCPFVINDNTACSMVVPNLIFYHKTCTTLFFTFSP